MARDEIRCLWASPSPQAALFFRHGGCRPVIWGMSDNLLFWGGAGMTTEARPCEIIQITDQMPQNKPIAMRVYTEG